MLGEETFENRIVVQYGLQLKKGKSGKSFICVRFHLIQKNLRIKETLVSTGISVLPELWNGANIIGSDMNTQAKNAKLNKVTLIVRDELIYLKRAELKTIPELLQEIVNGIKPKVTGTVPKGQKHIYLSRLRQHNLESVKDTYLSEKNVTEGYKRKFKEVVGYLNEFWQARYGRLPNLNDFNPKDLNGFETWMSKEKKMVHNSVATYNNKLITLFNHAIELGLLDKKPMHKGYISTYIKGKREILTDNETLEILSVPDEKLSLSLQKIKYAFLFMAATGLGYGELKAVRSEQIENINEQLFLQKDREKTGERFKVLFSPIAEKIYNKFICWANQVGITNNEEPFKELATIEYALRVLKKLALLAGITKNVTTYVARHTFATNWIRAGNNIYLLMKILGHKNVSTTQIYVDMLPNDILEQSNHAYNKSSFHTALI